MGKQLGGKGFFDSLPEGVLDFAMVPLGSILGVHNPGFFCNPKSGSPRVRKEGFGG